MLRRLGAVLLACALGACGGTPKQPKGPAPASGSGATSDPQAMADTPPTGVPGTPAAAGDDEGSGAGSGSADQSAEIEFPNLDPDPAQARAQVDQHLDIARKALAAASPDPDTALREAREALKIDAASVDAAAYVAFAYVHKKQYDTAELVLDDLFKRPAAKNNATVYYVYGLVYDATNRPDRAVVAYKQAVQYDPGFASAWINLGVHQLENKQYGEAQETFERVTRQLGRQNAVTLTGLGSAYRGRSAEYPVGSGERAQFIQAAEAAYKHAIAANPNYGPAYYDLGLLYLDADPFPSGAGNLDTLARLNAAKKYLDQYKNMPGVDMKLYDERMKDVSRAIKHEERKRRSSGGHS